MPKKVNYGIEWRMKYKTGWRTSIMTCRICGATHVAVYPNDIHPDIEEWMECPNCGFYASIPVYRDKRYDEMQ